MKRFLPSIGTPISIHDIVNGMLSRDSLEGFGDVIKRITGRRYVIFTNSGTSAFFVILMALKRISKVSEVILPAYTAPSLILPIREAGLTPRLCDIELDTFNIDLNSLPGIINDNTLAITIIHMFGIPVWFRGAGKDGLQEHTPFLVEDLASALGSRLDGKPAGSFGDIGFVSFNRGKNISTLAGGAILTDREDIYEIMVEESRRYLKPPQPSLMASIIFKTLALSLAVRPWFYTLFRSYISRFKYTELHDHFDLYGYTRFQAGLGISVFKRADMILKTRNRNGVMLHTLLSGRDGIILPELKEDSYPVFNQFPVVVKEPHLRDRILRALIEEGIEATTLYPEPIHRIYGIDYDGVNDPFPQATYISKRLLLIPTHPFVSERDIKRAADIVLRYL